jgi:AcrR family transcriptional regulator
VTIIHMKFERPARPYVQRRRAAAAAETGTRILEAATRLFLAGGGEEPTLDAVAAEAGVAVQTVLRRFGSKEGLFAACLDHGTAVVAAERNTVPPGDVPAAVDNLLDHYDAWGDRSLRLLWLAERSPAALRVVEGVRALHRDWVARAFGPQLAAVPAPDRPLRLAQLVAVTDVHVWKLLHRDQGLDRADTRRALLGLLDPLTRRAP